MVADQQAAADLDRCYITPPGFGLNFALSLSNPDLSRVKDRLHSLSLRRGSIAFLIMTTMSHKQDYRWQSAGTPTTSQTKTFTDEARNPSNNVSDKGLHLNRTTTTTSIAKQQPQQQRVARKNDLFENFLAIPREVT
jgi:hypothetical protein